MLLASSLGLPACSGSSDAEDSVELQSAALADAPLQVVLPRQSYPVLRYGQGGFARVLPKKFEAFQFQGKKGDAIVAAAFASQRDTFAALLDSDYRTIAFDDDGRGGGSAEIHHTLQKDGTYYIAYTAKRGVGRVRVTLEEE